MLGRSPASRGGARRVRGDPRSRGRALCGGDRWPGQPRRARGPATIHRLAARGRRHLPRTWRASLRPGAGSGDGGGRWPGLSSRGVRPTGSGGPWTRGDLRPARRGRHPDPRRRPSRRSGTSSARPDRGRGGRRTARSGPARAARDARRRRRLPGVPSECVGSGRSPTGARDRGTFPGSGALLSRSRRIGLGSDAGCSHRRRRGPPPRGARAHPGTALRGRSGGPAGRRLRTRATRGRRGGRGRTRAATGAGRGPRSAGGPAPRARGPRPRPRPRRRRGRGGGIPWGRGRSGWSSVVANGLEGLRRALPSRARGTVSRGGETVAGPRCPLVER